MSTLAVAIDKDKNSVNALKWAVDNLAVFGQTINLIHVNTRGFSGNQEEAASTREIFQPFRCFCTRKDVQCNDIILEDNDVAKAMIEFVGQAAIDKLVLGATSKGGFVRFKSFSDTPTTISKGVPDFCSVYIISKGKVSSVRHAIRPAPSVAPLRAQLQSTNNNTTIPGSGGVGGGHKPATKMDMMMMVPQQQQQPRLLAPKGSTSPYPPWMEGVLPDTARSLPEGRETIKSPFVRGTRFSNARSSGELSAPPPESDISFVSSSSSGRPSLDGRGLLPPRMSSGSSEYCTAYDRGSMDMVGSRSPLIMRSSINDAASGYSASFGANLDCFSSSSASFEASSPSQSSVVDIEAEMRRLRLELKQTMDMYSTACKEALTAKQKALELQRWKLEEQQRLEEARLAEEAALALAEKEKAKCKAAMEAAETSRRMAEFEAQKRISAERNILQLQQDASPRNNKASGSSSSSSASFMSADLRYRRYTIEEIEAATEYFSESRKIGEGGYGPVYKCCLDHTSVAVKVLRPDAAQGRTQFQQEVEILSCIRHPHMVLLLGACPEYGCLVYEYMANGSLEDRLHRRGNTPPIPWQHRFRIAAEIGTSLLFLHQTKPEPLVHRDLKPANILLDRNLVSKISDVGLARLVPPSVADSVTQYRMTSTAGTFCYIDPEYQQTGMLGIKSDIYSLGILLLQLVTGKPPMGLAHHVERSIERGTFDSMLDSTVRDWPVEDALRLAKVAIRCAELRGKDRPDLATVVLPELNRLRELGEASMQQCYIGGAGATSAAAAGCSSASPSALLHNHQQQVIPTLLPEEVISDPLRPGYSSNGSRGGRWSGSGGSSS